MKILVASAVGAAMIMAGGCVSRVDAIARAAQDGELRSQPVKGTLFDHVVFLPKRPFHGGRLIHVYIEGDGRPWRTPSRISADPTPGRSVVLPLMALDPAWSLYLGRPCYHGLAGQEPCSAWWWTQGRYGEPVVASMAAALERLPQAAQADGWVLIGHSGGGTLAMLLAERLARTRAVVTLSANLDVARWSAHHRYTPLTGSLDPARRPRLADTIIQIHLLAGRDNRVPPGLNDRVIGRHSGAVVLTYPDFDHDCCWSSVWPSVLVELAKRLEPPSSVFRQELEEETGTHGEHVGVEKPVGDEGFVVKER